MTDEITFFDDVMSKDSEQGAKDSVHGKEEEAKHSHGLLGADIRGTLRRGLRVLRENGEQDEHLLAHHENHTQEESNGQGGLILRN